MPRGSELRKNLVSLDIGQYNALVILTVNRSPILENIKKLLNDIFAECDRSSPIKKFTDSLNLGDLQVDDILEKFTAESSSKYIPVSFNGCFSAFSVRIGRGYQKLHMFSTGFCAIIR